PKTLLGEPLTVLAAACSRAEAAVLVLDLSALIGADVPHRPYLRSPRWHDHPNEREAGFASASIADTAPPPRCRPEPSVGIREKARKTHSLLSNQSASCRGAVSATTDSSLTRVAVVSAACARSVPVLLSGTVPHVPHPSRAISASRCSRGNAGRWGT